MNGGAVLELLRNDIKQYNRNKRYLISTFCGSAVILLVSMLVIAFPFSAMNDLSQESRDAARLGYPGVDDMTLALVTVSRTIIAGLLILPAMLSPGFLALSTMTAEKEQKTLECLLLLPVSDREILVSKILSSTPFALLGTWCVYLISAFFAASFHSSVHSFFLFDGRFLVEVLVLVPSLAILSAFGGIIVSINTADTRTAQSLAFIPQILLASVSLFLAVGAINLSWGFLFVTAILVTVLNILGFGIATVSFKRERMLLRY